MLLLRQVPAGPAIEGTHADLIDAARRGCDISLFIDNLDYPETILFRGAFVTTDNRFYGWLPEGIGRGRLGPRDEAPEKAFVVRCVFGCDGSVWIFRKTISSGAKRDNFHKPYDAYQMYSWIALNDAAQCASDVAGQAPTSVRCRLSMKNGTLIFQPNIVYFADGHAPGGKVAAIKGSGIILPGEIVSSMTGRIFDERREHHVMVHVPCEGRARLFVWSPDKSPPDVSAFIPIECDADFVRV